MAARPVVTGGRKLLFERLVDDPSAEAPHDDGTHDCAGLYASIAMEVERLFNTRLPLDAAALARRRRSTVDYGIPDLSLFPPRHPEAETALARHLAEAVQAFEPRLAAPVVTLERTDSPDGRLIAHVAGTVRLESLLQPLHFTVELRPHGG